MIPPPFLRISGRFKLVEFQGYGNWKNVTKINNFYLSLPYKWCQKNIWNDNQTFSSWSSAGEMLFPWSAGDSEPYFPLPTTLYISWNLRTQMVSLLQDIILPRSTTAFPSEVQSEEAGTHHWVQVTQYKLYKLSNSAYKFAFIEDQEGRWSGRY